MNQENDWKECEEKGTAQKRTPDPQKATALREVAKARTTFLEEHETNEKNANFLFEGHYTSTLETLHAHLAEKGINVKNHLCIEHYLRDVLKREDLKELFNDCRTKRNKFQYYGKTMEQKTAEKAIQKCKELTKKIEELERTSQK